ncbi:MAG: DUF898 family protein [Pseudomonadota bacterium]
MDQHQSAHGVRNDSRIGPMLWIGFYTFLLNIVTLTLFRFWGRTHFRRRLWSETTYEGEPLVYTGKGLELFVGFVIATVVLAVPFIAFLFASQLLLGEIGFVVALTLLYIVMFALIGTAIFLARRYHLSRTTYRGVRFAQTGSSIAYGFVNLGYILLTGITFGWFGPAARVRLSRRMWANAYYGSEPIRFEDTPEAKAEPVYKSFAVAWVGGLIGYIGWIALFTSVVSLEEMAESVTPDIGVVITIYATLIPFALFIGVVAAWHEAVMTRRITKSIGLGEARLTSRFSTIDMIELTITNMLLIIFTLGVGLMPAQMRLWKRYANRMSVIGEIDFNAIEQSKERTPGTGEGLADGLDIAANF